MNLLAIGNSYSDDATALLSQVAPQTTYTSMPSICLKEDALLKSILITLKTIAPHTFTKKTGFSLTEG